MIRLNLSHRTTYRYARPVSLGPHRMMLRPRERHDLKLTSYSLDVSADAVIAWAQDVFGNSIATVHFSRNTDHLVIDSRSELQLEAAPWPVFDVDFSAISYPFRYSDAEWTDLGALSAPQYADPAGRLRAWARRFIKSNPTDTLSLLKDISGGISSWINYQSRDDEGTQTPLETLDRGWGSCRDFAVLLVEAVRALGFGARIVSGYLYNPDRDFVGSYGVGSTHAWAEIYLPGAGWITFDPTNRSVGSFNLIPVGVGRDIRQVMPVAGSFHGMTDAFMDMRVEVLIVAN